MNGSRVPPGRTGRPLAAPQPELESHCIRVMPNISNLVTFGESANLTGLSPERETRRNRGSLRGRRLSIGGRVVWVNPATNRQAAIEAITVE